MRSKLLTPILIFVAVTALSAIVFSSPISDYIAKIPLVNEFYQNTNLVVSSRNGIAKVTIDGKEYGETPLELDQLSEGQHEVVLTRVTESSNEFYQEKKIFVDLYRNTEALIDMEIGPSGSYAGYTLYYSPAPDTDSDSGYITVDGNPEKLLVKIGDRLLTTTPVEIKELPTGEYEVKVSKDGYEPVEVPVVIRKGFNLNLYVELMPVPVNLNLPQ